MSWEFAGPPAAALDHLRPHRRRRYADRAAETSSGSGAPISRSPGPHGGRETHVMEVVNPAEPT